jgi:hypothetical protein
MNTSSRSSGIRLVSGGALLFLAALVAFFVLPDASQRKVQKQNASAEAEKALASKKAKLAELVAEESRLTHGQERLKAILGDMPDQRVGELQWRLSHTLFDLAQKNSVRLQSLKYGAPSREGAKGTDLEILDVEFTASGIYQNLKAFMLGLEKAKDAAKEETKEETKPETTKDAKKVVQVEKTDKAKDKAKEDVNATPLPFAVTNAKIEESPDGARLSVTVRAYQKGKPAAAGASQEGS